MSGLISFILSAASQYGGDKNSIFYSSYYLQNFISVKLLCCRYDKANNISFKNN